MNLKLRRYLNLKKVTDPEAVNIPRYVTNKLRAHRRPLESMPVSPRNDDPSTRGVTSVTI